MQGFGEFDLILSYTGGMALAELESRLGAKRAAPLYGSVDPQVHKPTSSVGDYAADISYLGTYSADRQVMLDQLFMRPARAQRLRKFIICGAQYPRDLQWAENIRLIPHLSPEHHAEFYCSSPLTLSVTRAPMAAMGWCPSGRLFEAAACGVPVLSDDWEGLKDFFEPRAEILVAHTAQDALATLSMSRASLARIGRAARERALAEHTSDRRAAELIELFCSSKSAAVRAPERKLAAGGS
jgi:spore maturation protein CgeB